MKRKIYLDIEPAEVSATGIGAYTRILKDGMVEASNVDFISIPRMPRRSEKCRYLCYLYEQLILPFKMLRLNGICHRTANIGIPFLHFTPYIITIHDIIPLRMPKYHLSQNIIKRKFYFACQRWSAIKAKEIITVSNYSKQDLVDFYGIDPDKITVTYLGANEIYKPQPPDKVAEIKQKYNVEEGYILGIGGGQYRKNVKSLIKAFCLLKEKTDIPYKLLIVGKKESFDGADTLLKDILYTGFVEDEDMPAVYSGAEVFVFPSLYEGFGLPVVEAQACGTAVITSNCTSLPEIAGDGAVLIDPNDPEAIAEALRNLLIDESFKKDLIQKGFVNCKRFDTKKTVEETLRVYERALK